MKSRCKDFPDFRPRAFPHVPSLIDLSKKGENPVTHDYYQLTHEIRNHGAAIERGETVGDQELFSIRLRLTFIHIRCFSS